MQQNTVLDEAGTASVLASSVSEAMLAGEQQLSVLDTESGEWVRRTWPEVHARATEIATQIVDDRQRREPHAVGLIGDPTVDMVAAVQGAWLAGVAVSILPGPIRGADEVRWAESTYARFVDIGVGTVLGSGPQLDLLGKIDGWLRVEQVAEYGLGVDTSGFEPRQLPANAPAVLQGTAGSTGEPKTAVLSTAAVRTNTTELIARLGLHRTRDSGFSWLPLYHDMGLTFLLAGMGTGIPLYLVPNSAFAASPFKWLEWLTESKATVTAAPNFAYDILGRYGKLLKDADLSNLRVSISGGEPIDPDAFDKFLAETERFGFDPAAASPAYGMAESTCAVTMPAVGEGAQYDEVTVTPPTEGAEPIRKRYAILGKPLGGMQIRIVEPNIDVPRIDGRDVGHVEIRGTSMMNGYLGHAPLHDGEWFPTGDLGYLVDGRLVICGRAKEIVIVAGRNLFPVEVERAAASVVGVKRGGVVAMARGEGSARPGLVVVAEYRGEDRDGARAEVISEVASECGIVPADVIFVEPGSVPRTTSGKLRRLETKQLVESGEWK
ncbi:long-chain-fatty acid--ACP ligase MbtM [Gordonia soli]|uniref:Putative fatty-acid--CoA ligase n=1 Tax=Gordonia soli NBRC 108243 TaxID=1223545 RepID=M0QQJ5_9ACTN|nr:long-chain-fatty acid--ACP ligase MbtM [Gordonia soli]GAC70669.1 putative fatty-acid--CoA ligase [Gordonia soli NBRC 108243]